MTQENFEEWDEQTLDPQNLPPLDDLSAGERQDHDENEGGDKRANAPESSLKKPVTAGRKARKPRQKAQGAEEKAGEQETESGELNELEAQGFTHDEAIRLIHVSDRAATSGEALEAEATMRRLRFMRWLVERGLVDEWSA